MTKIVAIVPMRHNSERVPGKNYRLLEGKPLYHHVIETLLSVPEIDQVVIDTDSPIIIEDAARSFPGITVLLRPDDLRSGDTSMNDVLASTISQVDADLYLQTHSTNPFLSAATVSAALHEFVDCDASVDSIFSVSRIQARLWNADMTPLNHNPSVLQRTQDLVPVFLENSSFYIFKPETLKEHNNRIGPKARMFEVPALEAIDIDEEHDFMLAIAVASVGSIK